MCVFQNREKNCSQIGFCLLYYPVSYLTLSESPYFKSQVYNGKIQPVISFISLLQTLCRKPKLGTLNNLCFTLFPSYSLRTFQNVLTLFAILGRGNFPEMLPGIYKSLGSVEIVFCNTYEQFSWECVHGFLQINSLLTFPFRPHYSVTELRTFAPEYYNHKRHSNTDSLVKLSMCFIELIRNFYLLIISF